MNPGIYAGVFTVLTAFMFRLTLHTWRWVLREFDDTTDGEPIWAFVAAAWFTVCTVAAGAVAGACIWRMT